MFNRLKRKISKSTNNQILFEYTVNSEANKKKSISASVVDRRTNVFFALILIIPALLVLTSFTVIPFIFNIYNAFTDGKNNFVGVKNINELLNDLFFAVAVRNSFIYALLVLPLTMGISILISSLISNLIKKTFKSFWQTVFFLPYVTNAVAVSLAFTQIFATDGQFNYFLRSLGFEANIDWLGQAGGETSFKSLLPMLINGIWNGLAFNILLFTTAMLSVDKNLYKSASIDGLSSFKQFFTITLPSISKTVTFILTIGIINGIKVFPLALFNNKADEAKLAGASTLMLVIYYYVKDLVDYQLAGAASLILFIIGVSYSSIIRGGFRILSLAALNKGESDVWTKIKDSSEIRELNSKQETRFSYTTSSW
ncbi:sn-glycerol-3-phosphate transport system permease protein ugpA [Mycoplasmopsis maculosa]|uniref:sn-glycerol-3-phosphate transport system permease protein ugpA n=1 Tax=Mycoplasmopsis maculosa TaxID=114885 RepID=A0A449B4F3_9BACT|nr:sugar ABC transporter permease [Mycoplasmopsis maculosa]VEU75477.1 sn-glycerol-3-phosphate transport system permease protein ugpA [Mycoplasmopsis maculosa]